MDLSVLSLMVGSFVEAVAENISTEELQYPVIRNYGGIMQFPNALQPDKNLKYKIVFDISRGAESNSELIPGLLHVAGLVNAFALSGITPQNMELAVVLRSTATKAALKDEAYQDFYYTDNPNASLVTQLKKAGLDLYVCAQSLVKNGYRVESVAPSFSLALSGVVAISTFQMKGYGVMSM